MKGQSCERGAASLRCIFWCSRDLEFMHRSFLGFSIIRAAAVTAESWGVRLPSRAGSSSGSSAKKSGISCGFCSKLEMAAWILPLVLLPKLEKMLYWIEGDKPWFAALIFLNLKYFSLWPGKRGSDGTSRTFTSLPVPARKPHSLNILVLTDAIQAAIDQLDLLGAVERKGDQLVLTPLGKKMAAFPLEPKFSKVKMAAKLTDFYLLYSSQYHWLFSFKLLK